MYCMYLLSFTLLVISRVLNASVESSPDLRNPSYICLENSKALCFGISGNMKPDNLFHLQLKDREINEVKGLDAQKARWVLNNDGSIEFSNITTKYRQCLSQSSVDTPEHIVLKPCGEGRQKNLQFWQRNYIGQSQVHSVSLVADPSLCVTVMACSRVGVNYCDIEGNTPYTGSDFSSSAIRGNYLKLSPCQGNIKAQKFVQITNCARDCSPLMLKNGVCDAECRTPGCKWDNGDCDPFPPTTSPTAEPTKLPTVKPTISPTTSKPTSSPRTSKPTKSPSRSPTFTKPTHSPTTARPSLSPTTSSPSTSPTTASPSTSPTTSTPSVGPTYSPIVELGAPLPVPIDNSAWLAWGIPLIILILCCVPLIGLLCYRRQQAKLEKKRKEEELARAQKQKVLFEDDIESFKSPRTQSQASYKSQGKMDLSRISIASVSPINSFQIRVESPITEEEKFGLPVVRAMNDLQAAFERVEREIKNVESERDPSFSVTKNLTDVEAGEFKQIFSQLKSRKLQSAIEELESSIIRLEKLQHDQSEIIDINNILGSPFQVGKKEIISEQEPQENIVVTAETQQDDEDEEELHVAMV